MFLYFLKVTICWLVFYLVYSKFLSKETFFKTNRWYLLGTLLLGAGIPLLEFLPIFQKDNAVVVYFQPISEGSFYMQNAVNEAVTTTFFDWEKFFLGLYIIGVAIFSVRFFIGLGKIYALFRKSEIIKKENHTLVLTNETHLPFSFFKYMFWSKDLEMNDVDGQKIVTHEVAHVKGWHSLDVILLEIFSIIFWVSPMVYFYKKSLKTVHEYLADAVVLQTTPTKKYGHLLLRQSQSGLQIALANHFFHSQLKQRIVMMTRSKSRKEAIVKYLFALPVILLLLIAFSKKEAMANLQDEKPLIEIVDENSEYNAQEIKEEFETLFNKYENLDWGATKKDEEFYFFLSTFTDGYNDLLRKYPKHDLEIRGIAQQAAYVRKIPLVLCYESVTCYKHFENQGDKLGAKGMVDKCRGEIEELIKNDVDEMPRFPGCEEISQKEKRDKCSETKLLTFIYSNIKYPAEARKADIQGKVIIKYTVQKDGIISKAKIARDIGGGCGEAALKVINALPKMIPAQKDGKAVAVEMAIPVKFKLEGGEKTDDKTEEENEKEQITVIGFSPKNENIADVNISKKSQSDVSLEELLKEKNVRYRINRTSANLAEVKALLPNEIATIDVREVIQTSQEEGEEKIETKLKVVIITTKGYQPQAVKKEIGDTGYYIDGKQASKKEVDALPLKKIATNNKSQVVVTKNGVVKTIDVVRITTKESFENSDPIFNVVEEMPRFKNEDCEKIENQKERKKCSDEEMLKYIYTNVKYPKVAREAGIQGRVIIKFTVQKDGSITDAKVLRDPGGGCGVEAERVVNMMPNFVPGKQKGKAVNVSYTLPISFKLAEPDAKSAVKIEGDNIKITSDMKPLFIIDGKEKDKSTTEELKPDDIETIHVLKGEKAIEKYGDKGKNGVVEVTLKKGKSKSTEIRTHPIEKKSTLDELGLTYIKISPNPSDGKINIEYESQDKPMTISIFDSNGKRIFEKKVAGGRSSLQNVDLSNEAKGVFFVTFEQEGKTYTEKIILQ